MVDPLSVVCSVVQIAVGAAATAKLVSDICEGIKDKEKIVDFLKEVKQCSDILSSIENTFDSSVREWINAPSPPSEDKLRAMCSNSNHIGEIIKELDADLRKLQATLDQIRRVKGDILQYIKREQKSKGIEGRRSLIASYIDRLNLSMNYINLTLHFHSQMTLQTNHQQVMRILTGLSHNYAGMLVEDSNTAIANANKKMLQRKAVPSDNQHRGYVFVNEDSNARMDPRRSQDSTYGSLSSLDKPSIPAPAFQYDEENWGVEKQWAILEAALDFVARALKDSHTTTLEVCEHQKRAIMTATHIRNAYEGRTRDGKPLNMQQLRLDLADYQTLNGDFNDAIRTLGNLLAELWDGRDYVDIKWQVLYKIGKSYNSLGIFDQSAGHAQAALRLAEDIFSPFDDRVIDTLQLVTDIFEKHGERICEHTFRKQLEHHQNLRRFADTYPHHAKDFKNSNVSPIILAAKKGHALTVQRLLQSLPLLGHARDESGATVLICATGNKHVNVVKVLRNGDRFVDGTDVNAVDNHRETALHRVMRQPPLDEDSNCPLEWAKVALEIVGMLLLADGDATLQNNDGETCAHVCVQNGHQEILEMLLRYNKSLVETTDNEKRTLLHLAIELKQTSLVQIILRAKPDLFAIDEDGLTCVDWANDHNLKNLDIRDMVNKAVSKKTSAANDCKKPKFKDKGRLMSFSSISSRSSTDRKESTATMETSREDPAFSLGRRPSWKFWDVKI